MYMHGGKAGFVNKVFTSVAGHYDVMNDLMSFGIHRLWKEKMISNITNTQGKLLDVASGTGDIALRVARKSNIDITLCDINYNMLKVGRDKTINLNLLNFKWLCADAESLPFSDNTFDYYTIAFGIRNVYDRQRALGEAYRVLNHGGKFICLEFSPPDSNKNSLFQKLYDFYSFNIIPKIGALVAKDKEAYEYLVESIRLFPRQADFKQEIRNSGFSQVSYYNMSCSLVSLYSGWKI